MRTLDGAAAVCTLTIFLAACSSAPPEEPSAGEWRHTTETEGSVTTVTTTSGSQWGGPAHLAEELSIGVLEGEEPYMFGGISAIWATDDEVYIVDAQAPAVRVFDREGRFLRQIGRPGSGPGEYERPFDLLVRPDGRVYVVRGERNPGIEVFDADGQYIESLDTQAPSGSAIRVIPFGMTLTLDDRLFVRASERPSGARTMRPEDIRRGVIEVGRDGPTGEMSAQPAFDFEPPTLAVGDGGTTSMPYGPRLVTAFSPTGAWIGGVSSDYSFEVHYPGGSVTRIERYWDPVFMDREEVEYHKRMFAASMQHIQDGWTWGGADMPTRKPAYRTFVPDRSGRVLVSREGPSRRVEDCDEEWEERGASFEPCWQADTIRDMFDLEGRYLGEIRFPDRDWQFSRPFIHGDELWWVVEEETGNVTAKMFRLLLPSDEPAE